MTYFKSLVNFAIATSLLLLFGATPLSDVRAQTADPAEWALLASKWRLPPRGPGLLIGGFLEAISTQDHSIAIAFAARFAPQDTVNTKGMLVDLHNNLGAFQVNGIDFQSETEVHLIVLPEGQEELLLIKLFLSDEEGSELTGIEITPFEPAYPEVPEFSDLQAASSFIDDLVKADLFSGRVLVAKEGTTAFDRAYGLADRVSGRQNTIDTKFDLGSITKFFTELALLKLSEDGLLDFDQKIGAYINNLPQDILNGPTVGQVMHMQGGFGHYYAIEGYFEDPMAFNTIDDLMTLIAKAPLDFEPGTDERYSNSGFVVLGAIIEAVTGMPYHDYIKQAIFEPAGMMDSGFYPHQTSTENNLAIPYSLQMSEDENLIDVRRDFGFMGNPSGSSYSTAADLLRFDAALRTEVFVSEETLIAEIARMRPPVPENADQGLHGFMGHAGGAQGVSTVYFTDFDNGTVVIVFANMDEPIAENLGRMLFRMMRNVGSNTAH